MSINWFEGGRRITNLLMGISAAVVVKIGMILSHGDAISNLMVKSGATYNGPATRTESLC